MSRGGNKISIQKQDLWVTIDFCVTKKKLWNFFIRIVLRSFPGISWDEYLFFFFSFLFRGKSWLRNGITNGPLMTNSTLFHRKCASGTWHSYIYSAVMRAGGGEQRTVINRFDCADESTGYQRETWDFSCIPEVKMEKRRCVTTRNPIPIRYSSLLLYSCPS